jgi:hypothetical protein
MRWEIESIQDWQFSDARKRDARTQTILSMRLCGPTNLELPPMTRLASVLISEKVVIESFANACKGESQISEWIVCGIPTKCNIYPLKL